MEKTLKIIFTVSLLIFLMLIVFQYSSLNINYFESKFIENDTEEVTNIEKEELVNISKIIIKYLEGKRDNLIIENKNASGLVFEERELKHMEDVRYLFDRGMDIRNFTFVLSLISFIALKLIYKSKLSKSLIGGVVVFSIVLTTLGLIIVFNFNEGFRIFHEILFDNDLWLLNPKEDILIQMLPSNFFYDLGLFIVKRYIFILFIILVASLYFNKKQKSTVQ